MSDIRLILASGSSRRIELLRLLGFPFEVIASGVEEVSRPQDSDVDFVVRTARDKGLAVASDRPEALVLSADTIVSVDGDILGKPHDREHAAAMLERLSGRAHWVYTAVFTVHAATGVRHEGLARTRVWFDTLDRPGIWDYLSREDVLDKAGAYAIQGFAATFIPRIDGDYTNVIGLPLPLTWALLQRHGLAREDGGSGYVTRGRSSSGT